MLDSSPARPVVNRFGWAKMMVEKIFASIFYIFLLFDGHKYIYTYKYYKYIINIINVVGYL